MDWLLYVLVIWISLDIIILATCWYACTTIAPRWPELWRQIVVDDEPEMNLQLPGPENRKAVYRDGNLVSKLK